MRSETILLAAVALTLTACGPQGGMQYQPPPETGAKSGASKVSDMPQQSVTPVVSPIIAKANANEESNIETIIGISDASVAANGQVKIRGFCLSPKHVKVVKIYINNQFLGDVAPNLRRPDVALKYPQYKSPDSGFLFNGRIDGVGENAIGDIKLLDDQDKPIGEKTFHVKKI